MVGYGNAWAMSEPIFLDKFSSALKSPLGPTRLSFAIKTCASDIAALRTAGSSWEQILVPLNEALAGHGRKALTTDTLRGVYSRYAPLGTTAFPPAEGEAQGRVQQDKRSGAGWTGITQPQEKLIKGELGVGLSDTLQDADRKAATLQQLKDML